jgi:hypothetical protein
MEWWVTGTHKSGQMNMAPRDGDPTARARNSVEKVSAFVELFTCFDSRELIRNLVVKMDKITIGTLSFPVSVNNSNQLSNCYICSPSAAYIDYAFEETRNFSRHRVLQKLIYGVIRACAPLVRASSLDHQVQLNNWLFSTNPVPEISTAIAQKIVERLTQNYPDRAIVIRSLNAVADQGSIQALKEAGFQLLASRQIYIFRAGNERPKHRNTIRRDQALVHQHGFSLSADIEFSDADFERCEILYNMLYLQKYTDLNPQYTKTYLKEMWRRGLLKLVGLRNKEGVIDAVTGLFENGITLTQPIVGYDTNKPVELGLYRIAMSLAQQYATENNCFFNMSAGAASFKRNRGAQPAIEYMAVYNRHLKFKSRATTFLIRKTLDVIGVPLLRRFEL